MHGWSGGGHYERSQLDFVLTICFLFSFSLQNTQAGLQVQPLWQVFQSPMAPTGPHTHPHGGEAILLPAVWQSLRGQVQLEGAYSDPLQCETLCLQEMQ